MHSGACGCQGYHNAGPAPFRMALACETSLLLAQPVAMTAVEVQALNFHAACKWEETLSDQLTFLFASESHAPTV